MNSMIKNILTLMSDWMPYISLAWICLGIATLIHAVISLSRDMSKLKQVEKIAIQAKGSDHNGKIRLRGEVVEWIDKHGSHSLQRWVYTVHNSALAGGLADASALTDSVWSQERERFRLFKYLCRYSVMVGLLFTSAGLCLTLMSVGPALQASGLEADAWMRTVQIAMAGALGGMSTAFYSSLYAIFTGLFLNLFGQVLYHRHDDYLARMDAFIQGTLVPIFTAIAEKDRNDVIAEVMEFTGSSFAEVQTQYKEALKYFTSQQQVAEQLTGNIAGFATQIQKLEAITQNLAGFSQPIAKAIETGLSAIRENQQTSTEQFKQMQNELLKPFTEAIEKQFNQQQRNTERVFNDITTLSNGITTLNTQITKSLQQMTDQISQQSESTITSSTSVAESVHSLSNSMKLLVTEQKEHMSKQTTDLDSITKDFASISNTQLELVGSLKDGINSISLSEKEMSVKIAELFRIHSKAIEKIYEQVQGRIDKVVEKVANQGLKDFHNIYNEGLKASINATHDKLTGLEGIFNGLVETHERTSETMNGLADALKFNEESIKEDFEKRRHIIDDAINKLSKESAGKLNESVVIIFDNSLKRQEHIVKELNEVLSKKWDDLLQTATSTVVS